MRIRTMVFWMLLLALSLTAFGEERERRPNRRGGTGPLSQGAGAPTIIKTGKREVYVMVGGFIAAFDAKTLKILAKKDLNEEESKVRDTAEKAANDAFGTLDKDQDGRLSTGELPIPERMLERMDRDRDGFISREEVPDFVIERFVGMAMRAAGVVGMPALEISEEGSLYVYHNGWLYRLDGRTLSILSKVEVEIPRPEGQTPRGQMPPAPDRFGDPGNNEDNQRLPMF